jgi:hypothetical protein
MREWLFSQPTGKMPSIRKFERVDTSLPPEILWD